MESKIEIIKRILLNEGGAPGSSLHSWRCEYPDRFPNYCTCLEDIAEEIAEALENHDGA